MRPKFLDFNVGDKVNHDYFTDEQVFEIVEFIPVGLNSKYKIRLKDLSNGSFIVLEYHPSWMSLVEEAKEKN